jgi:hypothetical protein
MTLRTQQVPNPAVGTDWAFTVPGQWVMKILGVSATLTTTANPVTATDSTGNGHNATYSGVAQESWGAVGPFGGSPNLAVAMANNNATAQNVATIAADAAFNISNLTLEAWVWIATGQLVSCRYLVKAFVDGSAHVQGYSLGDNGVVGARKLVLQYNGNTSQTSTGTFSRDAWHHVAVTSDGVNVIFYIDGVAAGTIATAAAFNLATHTFAIGGPGEIGTATGLGGRMASGAVWGSALSGAQIAAHFAAAATSAAAYKAAVLADTPIALWMLDATVTQTSRTATLTITDGTHTVGTYPGGTITGSASAFTWSWLTQAQNGGQTPNAQVNLVAIPALVLPAGYTIGTRTLDLVGTDQWSNITIWWDDSLSDLPGSGGGYGPYAYQNVLLIG